MRISSQNWLTTDCAGTGSVQIKKPPDFSGGSEFQVRVDQAARSRRTVCRMPPFFM
ncbi:hypothetical protein ACI50E_02060 [Brucella sp. ZJ1_1]|uniref:hypothetical protein n=1 Tax=Brucella TaxID=234 RepID=UPI001CA4F388|nr:hypothetical protein [Brucella intermedia]